MPCTYAWMYLWPLSTPHTFGGDFGAVLFMLGQELVYISQPSVRDNALHTDPKVLVKLALEKLHGYGECM